MSVGKKTVATAPNKPSNHVELTDEEKLVKQAEWDAFELLKPMKTWEAEMAATDLSLPRYAEDIIDLMTQTQKDRLATETLDAYNAKKAKRLEKP